MKKNQLKTKENNKLIMRILGMNDLEFELAKISFFQNYVEAYTEGNNAMAIRLMNSIVFSQWFENIFNQNNWRLINKYSLKSYHQRVGASLPVRITAWGLKMQFDKIHKVQPDHLYPDTAVLTLINKEESN